MREDDDEQSGLEMSERQRQVLDEDGGDATIRIEIPDDVADELDLEDGDDILWSGENEGDED